MRAFITGGSGFIGGHLIAGLLTRGWDVRALAHRGPIAEAGKIETLCGDICDLEILKEGLRGVDVLFHLASALGSTTIGRHEFHRINTRGTETALEAARRAGVPRVVHFSSAGVFGAVPEGEVADESYPPHPISIYDQTKLEGEQIALRCAREGMNVVVIRPGWAYGPGDRRTFKLVNAVCHGRFLMASKGEGRQTPVHIDDLVNGTLLAAAKGKGAEVYHLAGEEILTAREMVEMIALACGRKRPRLRLPLLLARTTAFLLEKAFSFLHREAPLNRAKLSFFIHSKPLSNRRAKIDLGFAPAMRFHEGMAMTVAWYRENGWLSNLSGR
jgi:dihydroflavonol-4-reductase